MNPIVRTFVFVGVAAVAVGTALATRTLTQPASIDAFTDVGTQFYPDFDNPLKAKGIRVASYDEAASEVKVFNVVNQDGFWTIPSHYNYPADGTDQLAKTAASVIGIERGALVTRSADDLKRLGLLDPLDKSITGTEGRGDRITLLGDSETVLVDYIVGNKVDGQENAYYIRRADETRAYRTDLEINLSTKFADWIERDLLELTTTALREMIIDRYSIDEQGGRLVQTKGEQLQLSRKSASDPWTLTGIKEETEKLTTATVNKMVTALDDLEIVGVRPKPPGLSAGLKSEQGLRLDPIARLSLQDKGYFLVPGQGLFSNEGEVRVATEDGVLYALRFGEVFTGSDVDVEIGASDSTQKEPSDDAPKETEAADANTAADAESPPDDPAANDTPTDDADATSDGSLTKNRYLFLTVHFDKSTVGEPPVKPTKPEEPKAEEPEAEPSPDESSADEPADADTPDADPSQADGSADGDATDVKETPDDQTPATDDDAKEDATDADDAAPDDATKPDAAIKVEPAKKDAATIKAEYEKALAQYEADMVQYKRNSEEYDEKIKDGKERVKKLNDRFADWYYVISADAFDDLHKSRAELVEPKEKKDAAPAGGAGAGGPSLDALKKLLPQPGGAAAPADEPAQEAEASEEAAPAKEGDATEEAPKAEDAPAKEGEAAIGEDAASETE